PRVGQPGVYEMDYVNYINGAPASYGSMVMTLPTTDSDSNGMPDITQLNMAASVSGTGTVFQDYPTVASVPLTAAFNRTAGQASGTYSIVYNGANVTGTWSVTPLNGTITYIRGNTNSIRFSLNTGGGLTMSGSTPFTINTSDQITLPQFSMVGNDSHVYTVLAGTTLNRTLTKYAGSATFFDFLLGTAWTDYSKWVFEITDTHDLDGNGVPDLSDAPPTGATITTQPESQTVNINNQVIFGVFASGTQPLKYQWKFNGANIAGATSPAYAINSAQAANAGNYSVLVTNLFSSVLSSNATLTVRTAPAITTQPANQTVALGGNAMFTVGAKGGLPLSYQWRFAGNVITNATDTTLTLNNVQNTNAGNYTVMVTNSLGSVTSAVAVLTIQLPPAITTQPTNKTVTAGGSVSFVVVASGSATLKYQWQFNGTNLASATTSTLTLNNVVTSQAGSYLVIVTNTVGAVTSSVAALTVNGPPGIISQPQNQTVLAGTNATFTVSVGGTAPFDYQWRLNGTNVAGATSSTLDITNAQAADVGNYTVVITNSLGSATSQVATLTVLFPPAITTQPQSQSVSVTSPVTFSVTATGTPTLNYQWRHMGTNLPGATTSSYSIASVQKTHANDYTVVITNNYGTVTSDMAMLTIATPGNVPGSIPGPTNMVSWWTGDGNPLDIQGTNDGTLQGGATYVVGKVGQGFNLSGPAYIQVPHSASLSFSTQMTVVAWIKPAVLGASNRIIDKHTAGANDGYFVDALSGKLRLGITNKTVVGASALPLNSFSLVSATYDGSAMKVYVNGNLDGTLAATGNIPANTLPFRIGANSNGGTNFNGIIDELMVFNRALTLSEIQSIYNIGTPGLSKGAGFGSIVRTGGQTQLQLGGRTGATFRIESSQDFTTWFEVITLTNSTGTINYTDSSFPSYELNYYRVVIP
ncbi:MAG: Immunoglobulin I-set domain protein, partial [Pedosphaera sp.]|nr:Immunoglobulin I-set domain protein [Pedosphaera sp.]